MSLQYLISLKVIDNLRPLLSDMEILVLDTNNYEEIESIFTNYYPPHICELLKRSLRLKRYETLLPLYPFEILDLDENLESIALQFINLECSTFIGTQIHMVSMMNKVIGISLANVDRLLIAQSIAILSVMVVSLTNLYRIYDVIIPQDLKNVTLSKLQELIDYNKNLTSFTTNIKKLIT